MMVIKNAEWVPQSELHKQSHRNILVEAQQARNWRAYPGGAKPACTSTFEGQQQVNDSLGDKTMQTFLLGGITPCPLQVRAWKVIV